MKRADEGTMTLKCKWPHHMKDNNKEKGSFIPSPSFFKEMLDRNDSPIENCNWKKFEQRFNSGRLTCIHTITVLFAQTTDKQALIASFEVF